MDLLRPLRRGSRWRRFTALTVFLASAPFLPAQELPLAARPPAREFTLRADSQVFEKGVYHLRGQVHIEYEQMRVTADEASLDETTGEIIARGHVVFTDPKSHLEAQEVHYNIRTQKGWFSDGVGYVHSRGTPQRRLLKTENPFYFSGQTVERIGEDMYNVSNGTMTTCECARTGWQFSVRRARIIPDERATARDAVFRFLGVPIFYFPYLVTSIAREPRQTGFLFPSIGNSTQKGYIIGDGFFWAINPSTDVMLGVEDYSKRGLSERGEFRAKPTANSDFVVDYFGVNDKYSGTTEVFDYATNSYVTESLRAPGESINAHGKDDDIGDGFRAVASIDYVNTMAFRLTWSPSYTEAVSSEAVQSGFITKNWDAYSFNTYAERYEDFLSTQLIPGNSVIIRHLPSVQFSGNEQQISDSPLYYSFQTSADAVGRTESGLTIPLLNDRLDFYPQLLLRPKEFWHFRFIPSVGFRVTHYGTSLLPNHAPLTRLLANFSLDLRPPSLEKVLNGTYRGYRLKHVIEPDIQYHLVRAHDPEDILDIIRFDAMDIFTETNEIEYSLTNTIMARKDDGPDDSSNTPQAQDIFSWKLSQKYYFDPTFGGALIPGQNNVFASTIDVTGFAFAHGQHFSPVNSTLRFAPFSNFDTEVRTDVNPEGTGGILDAGITSRVKHGLFGLALTNFFVNRSSYFSTVAPTPLSPTSPAPLTVFNLLGTVVTYGDPNRKGLSGSVGVDYNFQQKIFQHQITQVSYNFGCFAINLEYQYYNLGPLRRESQFRIALALANVGTFGNLRPSQRLTVDSPF